MMGEKVNPFVSRLWVKIAMVILLLVVLILFSFIVHTVFFREEQQFDSTLTAALFRYKTPEWVPVAEVITMFGSNIFLFPAYLLMAGFQFYRGRKMLAVNIGILGLSSVALLHGLKAYFKRDRPDTAVMEELSRYSFPSGHTMSAFIFCCIAGYLTWKTRLPLVLKVMIIFLLTIFALLVGFSRIVLGVHYPSDVAGGLALGAAWVLVSIPLLNRMNRYGWRTRKGVNVQD